MITKPDINNIIMKYLGTNYKFNGDNIKDGLDCINLCCLVAKDLGYYIPNINHIMCTIDNYQRLFDVRNDKALWEAVEPQLNTLVVFKINGVVKHVGYMLNNYQFIHILEGSRVTVDFVTNPQWAKRIVGYYKYVGSN